MLVAPRLAGSKDVGFVKSPSAALRFISSRFNIIYDAAKNI
jgi:hypothetical protein